MVMGMVRERGESVVKEDEWDGREIEMWNSRVEVLVAVTLFAEAVRLAVGTAGLLVCLSYATLAGPPTATSL
jgi:hypothetical protein